MLFLILFIWQIPHTFAIAMRRYHEYKAANVPMLPVVYGFDMAKRQTAVYVLCLLPIPLFLTSLGNFFVVVMSILNLVWAYIAIRGLFKQYDDKYDTMIIIYSMIY